jgi:hypothetical protein
MKVWSVVLIVILAMLLASCGMSQRRAAKADRKASQAQESVSNERLKLVDEYKACVGEAGDDQEALEACDSYLKAAQALQ